MTKQHKKLDYSLYLWVVHRYKCLVTTDILKDIQDAFDSLTENKCDCELFKWTVHGQINLQFAADLMAIFHNFD